MSHENLQSYRDVLNNYKAQYELDIDSGKYTPFVYPWATLPAFFVILYLLVPHRNSSLWSNARFFVFIFSCYTHAWFIVNSRSLSLGSGFGVGILSAWAVLWTATHLVVHDAQTEFKRIERLGSRKRSKVEVASEEADAKANVHVCNGSLKGLEQPEKEAKRVSEPSSIARRRMVSPFKAVPNTDELGPTERTGPFAWQPYPTYPFRERVDWVLDLAFSLRGMGWNWRIPNLPPPPKWVQLQLRESCGTELSSRSTEAGSDGTHVYPTKVQLINAKLRTFLLGYMMLDVLKVVMMKDPYFWGALDMPPPQHLPTLVSTSPSLLKTYRLLLTYAGVYTALQVIFTFAPLFYVGLLGPTIVGGRAQPWLYPDAYGSFTNVLDKGLAGWWGGWWHQTFRFAFESPSRRLIHILGIDRKGLLAKGLQLVVAFALSGALHACGSHTQLGDTRPLRGPFVFFMVQPLGILAQMLFGSVLTRYELPRRVPRAIRWAVNFVFVHCWLYYTAPLLVDDFARGGMWLFEPVPLSPLRGLGFGIEGDIWWCWGGKWFKWYQGRHFWQTGWSL